VLIAAGAARAQQQAGGIVVVSRDRILREAAVARRLREAEAELTELLQGQIDATKAAFAAEEQELARLRGELPEAEFEARVTAFDERVRLARRVAQERAAVLQTAFQDARAAILAALPTLMERLRVETGASIVLNADQVLAMDAGRDLTDRAIALFDAEGPSPPMPDIDLSAPLLPPEEPAPAEPPAEPPGDTPGTPADAEPAPR
jgi:Skp family chaperone for outer membrane proteins